MKEKLTAVQRRIQFHLEREIASKAEAVIDIDDGKLLKPLIELLPDDFAALLGLTKEEFTAVAELSSDNDFNRSIRYSVSVKIDVAYLRRFIFRKLGKVRNAS